MIVLGIDASMVQPGFAVIDTAIDEPAGWPKLVGWSRPNLAKVSHAERCRAIVRTVLNLVDTFRPALIATETSYGIVFAERNAASVDALPFSRGLVAGAVLARASYQTDPDAGPTPDLVEYRISEARAGILGTPARASRGGTLSKELSARYLEMVGYDLPVGSRGALLLDVADALLLAIFAARIAAANAVVSRSVG